MNSELKQVTSSGGYWLRRALNVLVSAENPERIGENAIQWDLMPMKRKPTARGRFTSELHSHEPVEICLAVDGEGFIDIEDKRYRLRFPAMVILGGGVPHSEGFSRLDRSYATAWLTLRKDGMGMFVARYVPGEGWHCPWSGTAAIDEMGKLGEKMLSMAAKDLDYFEQFRTELISMLGSMCRRNFYLDPRDIKNELEKSTITPGHQRVLEWVRRYLDKHFNQPINIEDVAGMTRYTPNYLDSLFSKWTGFGIRSYMINRRMGLAMRLCKESKLSISEIARHVGYEDPLYFSRAFRKFHGYPPTDAR
jgi:AraC-like DNA-binding protein